MAENHDSTESAFLAAATVPVDGSPHGSGGVERANEMLAAHPELASASVYTAAVLGDAEQVRRLLAADAGLATVKGGPHGWDALTYLCFSRYLRLDRSRSDGFLRAATTLLDAGANANTGWFDTTHQPKPEWESAIYGAAGIARDAALTKLLLDRGADPNDEETPYHAPETYDNAALKVLVESGKLHAESVAMLLLRKADWHDHDGIDWLLAHGADPNRPTRFGHATVLHHAVRRDNSIATLMLLLDRGADARRACDEGTAIAMAARRGRGDFLLELKRWNVPFDLEGVDELIAACAMDDAARAQAIALRDPRVRGALVERGGQVLAEFAGNGNTDGLRLLLDLGVPVSARFAHGDGYWGIAPDSTALHVAAWRAQHLTVKVLIERGADVNALDRRGRSPLLLAVKASVDSYWTTRRAPDSIAALLAAGASTDGIQLPTGYADADRLIQQAQDR